MTPSNHSLNPDMPLSTKSLTITAGQLLLFVALMPSVAPGQTEPTAPDSSAPPDTQKSTAVARGVSAGATALPAVVGTQLLVNQQWDAGTKIIGGGLVLGPSAGIFYAGAPRRALKGILIRTGIGLGSTLLSVGIAQSATSGLDGLVVLAAGIVAGTVGILGHALKDILHTSEVAVEDHNETIRSAGARSASAMSVGPWASPHDGTPGVQVRVAL